MTLYKETYIDKWTGDKVQKQYAYKGASNFHITRFWAGTEAVRGKRFFINGNWSGAFRGWHRNGKRAWERYEKNGIRYGTYKEWHENGAKSFLGNYELGELRSGEEWDASGNLIKTHNLIGPRNNNGELHGCQDIFEPWSLCDQSEREYYLNGMQVGEKEYKRYELTAYLTGLTKTTFLWRA